MENSRDESLIEDYLFRGYKPAIASKTALDADLEFARPIEDEDIFCLGGTANDAADDEPIGSSSIGEDYNNPESEESPFANIGINDRNSDSPELIENQAPNQMPSDANRNQPINLDEIFINDYSNDDDCNQNGRSPPRVSYQVTTKQTEPPPPSPAELKKERMRQQILQQLRENPIQPKAIGSDINSDKVEFMVELSRVKSCSKTKFLFDRMFNKSSKAKDLNGSPGLKVKREDVQEALRRRITEQKRKVWDSFLAPIDAFDDEEEMIKDGVDDLEGEDEAKGDEAENLINDGEEIVEIIEPNKPAKIYPKSRIVETDDEEDFPGDNSEEEECHGDDSEAEDDAMEGEDSDADEDMEYSDKNSDNEGEEDQSGDEDDARNEFIDDHAREDRRPTSTDSISSAEEKSEAYIHAYNSNGSSDGDDDVVIVRSRTRVEIIESSSECED